MIIVYGIKNCDTCRSALKWLSAQNIEHRFHDFRKDGIDASKITAWVGALGWETVLNKRSTTWKGLAEPSRANLDDKRAIALMAASPTLIKRPVIGGGANVTVGFTDTVQKGLKHT